MITIAQAQAAIGKIVAATEAAGHVVAIVIVDEHGDEVTSYRMDGCRPRFIKVAFRKAYTAALMDRSTEAFKDEIDRRQLQIVYYGDPLFTALPGGIPITGPDGTTIGGIGVTGITRGRDAEFAAAGLPCFAPTVIPSAAPNVIPSAAPNVIPSVAPNVIPSVAPNVIPSVVEGPPQSP